MSSRSAPYGHGDFGGNGRFGRKGGDFRGTGDVAGKGYGFGCKGHDFRGTGDVGGQGYFEAHRILSQVDVNVHRVLKLWCGGMVDDARERSDVDAVRIWEQAQELFDASADYVEQRSSGAGEP